MFDFFGIKIIMGYIKMPHLEDYFNEQQLFQFKIFEYFKEGRFECLDQWSNFTGENLLKIQIKQSQFMNFKQLENVKKFEKVQKIYKLQENIQYYKQIQNLRQIQQQIVNKQYFVIQQINQQFGNTFVIIFMKRKQDFKLFMFYNNAKITITLQQISFLKIKLQIQCVSMIDNQLTNQIPQVPLYLNFMSIIKEQNLIFAFTCGQLIQQQIFVYNQYKETMLLNCINDWIIRDNNMKFLLNIIKNKRIIKLIDLSNNFVQDWLKNYQRIRLHRQRMLLLYYINRKQQIVALGTQIIGDYGLEISGILVILCVCDCFYLFDQNTQVYIINIEDITKAQYKSIEQFNKQIYHQAFQKKPGLMYENVDKSKSVQYAKQVEIE
ncbi:unnamed protein product [Paramecium sonneborni]|uniref:PiggyBac transposable element-derived protein domain-containing protein n=1 Tax=Paramecium sonneborni TaxID=65129 RepID=A0A8S1KZV1_9CILI|nr:unnamed protein product [Paramecium sonneborni]